MKKTSSRLERIERDTMRREYDFSEAVRGVTAARYAQGANIAVIDPEVLDVFPDATTSTRRCALSRLYFGSSAEP